MADIDPWLMQQVLDISKRQRETDVEHHLQADDVGIGFEVANWGVFVIRRGYETELPRSSIIALTMPADQKAVESIATVH